MVLTEILVASSAMIAGQKAYKKYKKEKLRDRYRQLILQQNSTVTKAQKNDSFLFGPAKDLVESFRFKEITPLFSDTRQQQLAEISSNRDLSEKQIVEKRTNRALAISLTSLSFAILGPMYWPLGLLSGLGMVYVGIPLHKRTFNTLKEGQITVHTLVTLVTAGCLLNGYFFVGNLTAVFYWISSKLTLKVKDDSRNSFVNVFRQQPRSVWVSINDTEVETPFEALKQGDLVVVHAGETVPVDGKITEGMASIDQHILTGESQPVEKEVGDQVFAATVALAGKIYIEVEKAGEETTAAQIGQILNNTDDFKSSVQLRTEVLADKTVLPTLITSALALPFFGPAGALAISNAHFKYKMGVTAPISILNYLNLMSQEGILVKDGRVLDLLNQVDTVVFDKTGTLTQEQPHVGAVYVYAGYSENEVLSYAAAAEYKQKHPIARAILQAATDQQLDIPIIDESEYTIGYGLTVRIDGRLIRVGSGRFLEEVGINISQEIQESWDHAHHQGHSMVMVAIDNELVGAIELVPTVRPEAQRIIQELRQLPQIQSIYIISGDHTAPTKKLAHDLGIDHYFAETLPENKAEIIDQLQDEGKFICYVGDGINDSIALKKAPVGISLRGASTVATDTAQIILMDESLNKLPVLFDLSQEFGTNIKRGLTILLTTTFVGIGGVLFLNFGLVHTVVLNQIATLMGISNSMLPLLFRSNKKLQDGKTTIESHKAHPQK